MAPSRRLRLALPFVALAALFAMHGLGDHTAAHASEVSGHHSGMTFASMEPTPALPTVGPLGPTGDPGLAFVCLGLLAGAGLALALLLARRRPLSWVTPGAAWRPAPTPHSRDPDPPPLALLSVCRC